MGAPALALLLSDARFPSGSHAHSSGVEEACDRTLIHDEASLDRYLRGRLDTTGTVAANLAAAVCARLESGSDPAWLWPAADAEADARMASPAARLVSRQQGGQLLRTAVHVFDDGEAAALASLASERVQTGLEPHHAIVMGAAAAQAGLAPADAATAAAYGLVATSASAALRLLGLDPGLTARVVARLAPDMDRISAEATLASMRPLARLPSMGAPVADLLAEVHFERKERLFAS
jgi:urease accessory protein